jgi:hypothetical protein
MKPSRSALPNHSWLRRRRGFFAESMVALEVAPEERVYVPASY